MSDASAEPDLDPAAATASSPASGTGADRRGRRASNRLKRRLLDIIALLHRWAESGWSRSAVGTWAFLQSSVVPGPSDALLIPLGLADPKRAFELAAWSVIGATLGGLVAYGIGTVAFAHFGPRLLTTFGVTPAEFAATQAHVAREGWLFILSSSLPVLGSAKIASIAAGAFRMPVWQFALALFVARAVRFAVVAALVRFAGSGVVAWIEKKVGRPIAMLDARR